MCDTLHIRTTNATARFFISLLSYSKPFKYSYTGSWVALLLDMPSAKSTVLYSLLNDNFYAFFIFLLNNNWKDIILFVNKITDTLYLLIIEKILPKLRIYQKNLVMLNKGKIFRKLFKNARETSFTKEKRIAFVNNFFYLSKLKMRWSMFIKISLPECFLVFSYFEKYTHF